MDCKYLSSVRRFYVKFRPFILSMFVTILEVRLLSTEMQNSSTLLNYMSFQDKQLKSVSAKSIDSEILAKHKKKEREAAKQGKRPFYIKKCNAFFITLQMVEMQFLISVFHSFVLREAVVCGNPKRLIAYFIHGLMLLY